MNRTTPLRTSAATAAALATAVLAAGCGSEDASGSAGDGSRGDVDPNAGLYRVQATVLANGEHGPQLCRTLAESMPPQCGGPDIVGWEWDDVRAHRARDTTYTDPLDLVGTWDGERFTLAEKPRPAGAATEPGAPEAAADFDTPCADLKDEKDPKGGKDTAGAGGADRQRVLDKAGKMPGYAGSWLDGGIVNIRFAGTGDGGGTEAAERELRGVWDGPLCVVGAEHSEAELTRVQRQLDEDVEGMLSSAVDPVRNAVTLEVVAATPELRRELDRTYGENTVRLSGWLEPVA
ncbi:hypothetical protein [Streptomyces sp. CMB-StM0423]|uniref:hypothetical protein n=1 Tax=Streptomyces sp. CMB-StM0423 TaxID=2059884 RepID=UPI000C708305|nr:hypothetical protein [Streptomyces sp. CMB-StM0423]AUH43366.1 hypothetical protein CXR04_27250 [Streptomyces sp. CMB-StM0423]